MKRSLFLIVGLLALPIVSLFAQNVEVAPAAKPATASSPGSQEKAAPANTGSKTAAPTRSMAPGKPAFAPRTNQGNVARTEPAQAAQPPKQDAPKE